MQGSLKDYFHIKSSSTYVDFLTEIFMDQVKAVVTEKHEFGKQPVPIFLILFQNIRTIKFLMQGTKSTLSQKEGFGQV